MFGSTPVISTSFGGCKGIDYKQSIRGMMGQLRTMYGHHEYLLDSPRLSDRDKELFKEISEIENLKKQSAHFSIMIQAI